MATFITRNKLLYSFKAVSFKRSYASNQAIINCLQELSSISVTPGTPEYEKRTQLYNPAYAAVDPAFVALPKTIEDCQRCLKVASKFKVPVAVRSGGHCFAGYSTTGDNGFVISLANMKNMNWNDTTLKVQAGASWKNVYDQMPNDKLVVGGCCPSVGIGGYVLGGGYGLLSRRFGLASDNALTMTMVTADGEQVVKASPSENSDLFWGLCGGGGGNFGLLVDITFKLHQAPPTKFMWTSFLLHNQEDSEKALKLIAKHTGEMPNDLNVDMLIHKLPKYNQLVVDAVYDSGSSNEKFPVIEGLKALDTKYTQETFHYKDLSAKYAKRHGYVHFEGNPVYMKGSFLDDFPAELANDLVQLDLPDDPLGIIEFVHVGGQIASKSPSYSAYPHRNALYNCYTYGRFNNSMEWMTVFGFSHVVHSVLASGGYAKGAYVNYMDRYLCDWTEEYYGSNYPKLCAIKKIWNDVENGGPMHFLQEIGSTRRLKFKLPRHALC